MPTFFADLSEAELNLSVSDVFELPQSYEEMGGTRLVRVAIIPPSTDEGQQIVQFYEMVASNRGWTVKQVSNKQQAVEWLTGNNPSTNSVAS